MYKFEKKVVIEKKLYYSQDAVNWLDLEAPLTDAADVAKLAAVTGPFTGDAGQLFRICDYPHCNGRFECTNPCTMREQSSTLMDRVGVVPRTWNTRRHASVLLPMFSCF